MATSRLNGVAIACLSIYGPNRGQNGSINGGGMWLRDRALREISQLSA